MCALDLGICILAYFSADNQQTGENAGLGDV